MRKRIEDSNKIPCGRTESDSYLCCLSSDYTWKSNRVVIERIKFGVHRKRLYIRIHYAIYCRKCGCMREQGNCFGWNTIRQLITGKIRF